VTITVIIPTLNEASTIAETIRHTAGLGVDQIIVVDGGSQDRTREVVESLLTDTQHQAHSTLRLLSSSQGRARQMNTGARSSQGQILLFLHADTRLPDTAKQNIESALADPDVVGGRFDVRLDSPSAWAPVVGTFMNLRSRLTCIATGDQAIFVRRDVFERLGGFSNIPLMEDIEFSSRLKRTGPTAALRETVSTSFRRWEQQGPLKTILLMWILRFLYWIGVSSERLARLYKTVR
jgi:rSAM/selenodomain-associated transferase 2